MNRGAQWTHKRRPKCKECGSHEIRVIGKASRTYGMPAVRARCDQGHEYDTTSNELVRAGERKGA